MACGKAPAAIARLIRPPTAAFACCGRESSSERDESARVSSRARIEAHTRSRLTYRVFAHWSRRRARAPSQRAPPSSYCTARAVADATIPIRRVMQALPDSSTKREWKLASLSLSGSVRRREWQTRTLCEFAAGGGAMFCQAGRPARATRPWSSRQLGLVRARAIWRSSLAALPSALVPSALLPAQVC